jgi:trehalose 6-phosphate synthase
MRTALLRGLAGADVLGFQSKQWAENYLLSARSLPEFHVLRGGRMQIEERDAAVRAFPVAVSAEPLRETAAQPEAESVREELRDLTGERSLILRVDRLELSKNILRGFLSYELFLRRNPQWRDKCVFLCLFSPSREDVPEYQDYGEECLAEAKRINAEFGTKSWMPIDIRVQEDYAFAVAAYALYDVLFVNPAYDGMNLVAMEGPLVNRRNGVAFKSASAGASSASVKARRPHPLEVRLISSPLADLCLMIKTQPSNGVFSISAICWRRKDVSGSSQPNSMSFLWVALWAEAGCTRKTKKQGNRYRNMQIVETDSFGGC